VTDKETIARWHAGTSRRISGTGGERAARMTRRYDFPAEAVWDAWTNPDRLPRWLGEVSGDFRPGGEVLLDMAPDTHGPRHTWPPTQRCRARSPAVSRHVVSP